VVVAVVAAPRVVAAARVAVVVATGSSTHHPIGSRVLEASKHLFVEKPLALTVDHATELVVLPRPSPAVTPKLSVPALW